MSRGAEDGGTNVQAASGAVNQVQGIAQCPKCGTKMPASRPSDRCPVCQLRGALDAGSDDGMDDETVLDGVPEALSGAFGHYELAIKEDGTPIELGRGAMGVTYKAIDTNLHRPVALKVINARYLDSEGARRRFVREARSAAKIRHPNVASVFHLGTQGRDY